MLFYPCHITEDILINDVDWPALNEIHVVITRRDIYLIKNNEDMGM